MANTILITANWHTGALSQQTISRQYDNNRYVVQFVGYPEASDGNELDYYLLVWMSSAPGEKPDEIAPIQLASDQWYISNVFTQQTQQIKFQMCALNAEGTFEAHSPIFTGFVRNSLEHDGTTQDIDVSTLFDAYREYLNELIIRAGAVVIDSTPTQGSNNAVSSGGVWEAVHNTDVTLTQSGQAADAFETGNKITSLNEDLNGVIKTTGKQYSGSSLFTVVGSYINHLGGITVAATYSCSDYIPVKQGDKIEYSLQVSNDTVAIGYYASTTSLTGFTKIVNGTGAAINGTVTITNDGYIRVASINTYISGSNAYIKILGAFDELSEDVGEITTDLSVVSAKVNGYEPFFDDEKAVKITAQTITFDWTTGSYYNLTTGAITTSASMARTEKYPCKAGDVIVIPNHAGQIVFFKSDGTVSYKTGVKTYTTVRSAPANTIYFALNNNDSTVQAASVTQKSASAEIIKKTVKAPARLLCDSDMFVAGVYANTTTGNISTGVSNYYGLANYPVKANHKYRTQTKTQVVFYDADMTFISALLPGGAASNTGTRVEQDFTTPVTCAYISINTSSAIEKLFDVDEYDIAGFISNPQKLSGMTVLQFGDSITGNYPFGDNISYHVEEHTGAKTINCGFGGCRMELLDESGSAAETAAITNPFAMCTIVDELAKDDDDPTKWAAQDEAAATFEASPRFNRIIKFRLAILKEVDITDVDIVTIAFGTNEIGYAQDNENNKYDKYTFAGSIRYSIEKLFNLNPNLRIILLTPIYRHDVSGTGYDSDEYVSGRGLSMADNINTLKTAGGEYKIPVIDMYHDLGINALNYASYFGDDDESDDGTHINTYGRKRYGERLAGELNRLF